MDYVPHRGDYITVAFDPQAGHEQKGRRPALVISHTAFNQRTGLALVCPITKTDRKFPFHVPVSDSKISGFVMAEQVKSIDFRARHAKRAGKASMEVLDDVLSLLEACLF